MMVIWSAKIALSALYCAAYPLIIQQILHTCRSRPKKSHKEECIMLKPLYSTLVNTLFLLVLILVFPSQSKAVETYTPNNSGTASLSGIYQADVTGTSESYSSRLLVAEADGEHYCARHCRDHYEDRMRECLDPNHPHHHRCEDWAREREHECLENCYREHGR